MNVVEMENIPKFLIADTVARFTGRPRQEEHLCCVAIVGRCSLNEGISRMAKQKKKTKKKAPVVVAKKGKKK